MSEENTPYRDYREKDTKKEEGGIRYRIGDTTRNIIITHSLIIASIIKTLTNYTIIIMESTEQINMINAFISENLVEEVILIEESQKDINKHITKLYPKLFPIINYEVITEEELENITKEQIEFKVNNPFLGTPKVLEIKDGTVSLKKFQKTVLNGYFWTIRGSKMEYGVERLTKAMEDKKDISTLSLYDPIVETSVFYMPLGIKAIIERKLREISSFDATTNEMLLHSFIKNIPSKFVKNDKGKPVDLLSKKNIKSNIEYIGKSKFYDAENPKRIAQYIVKKSQVEEKPLKSIGNALYSFDETHWKGYTSDEFISEIDYTLRPEGVNFYKPKLYERVKELIQYQKEIQEEAGYFQRERNTFLIPFKNGLYDPMKDELIPHTPQKSLNYVIDVAYDIEKKTLPPTRWLKALKEWGQSEETINFLQEFVGQMFSSHLHGDSKFLFLVGSGSNGKSVFIDVLENIVGDLNSVRMSIEQMAEPEYLIQIKDKTAVFSSEGSMKYLKKSKAIKNAVHGEKLSVADKYEKAVSFRPFATYIFATNHNPLNADKSDGWLRRFEMLKFENVFKEEDKDRALISKLLEEKEQIIAWCMEGYKRYINNGLRYSKSEQLETSKLEYEKTNNPVFDFYTETFEITKNPNDMVSTDIVYDLFKEYKTENGQEKLYKKKNGLLMEIRNLIKNKEEYDPKNDRLYAKSEYKEICQQHGTFNCPICKDANRTEIGGRKGIYILRGVKLKTIVNYEEEKENFVKDSEKPVI